MIDYSSANGFINNYQSKEKLTVECANILTKPRQSFSPDSLFSVRHHVIADANRGENKRTRIMKEKISRIDELFTIYD